MNLAEKTIEIARTQLGVTEHPLGSNRGPEVDAYLKSVGLDPEKKLPWCAAFVSWCVTQAVLAVGGPPRFRPSGGALMLLQKNPGLILARPEVNSIFVMDHGGGKGHTGFVLSFADPKTLHTLEGNTDANGSRTGGQCMQRTRLLSECAGFLRIG